MGWLARACRLGSREAVAGLGLGGAGGALPGALLGGARLSAFNRRSEPRLQRLGAGEAPRSGAAAAVAGVLLHQPRAGAQQPHPCDADRFDVGAAAGGGGEGPALDLCAALGGRAVVLRGRGRRAARLAGAARPAAGVERAAGSRVLQLLLQRPLVAPDPWLVVAPPLPPRPGLRRRARRPAGAVLFRAHPGGGAGARRHRRAVADKLAARAVAWPPRAP